MVVEGLSVWRRELARMHSDQVFSPNGKLRSEQDQAVASEWQGVMTSTAACSATLKTNQCLHRIADSLLNRVQSPYEILINYVSGAVVGQPPKPRLRCGGI